MKRGLKQKYALRAVRNSVLECVVFYVLYRCLMGFDLKLSIVWTLVTALVLLLFDVLFYRFYLRPRLLQIEREQKEQAHLDVLFYRFYLRPRLLQIEREQKEQAHLTRE